MVSIGSYIHNSNMVAPVLVSVSGDEVMLITINSFPHSLCVLVLRA